MSTPTWNRILLRCSLAIMIVLTVPAEVRAQAFEGQLALDPSRSGAMYEELARMDSVLFDASFVSCDAEAANAIFADDVEFYHDQTGFQSSRQTRENTRRLADSCPGERGTTRTLVEGSLQVYPIRDYGAVQTGVHRFEERDAATSTVAKFVHLWQQQEGGWRLTRILSFDHRPESVEEKREGEHAIFQWGGRAPGKPVPLSAYAV